MFRMMSYSVNYEDVVLQRAFPPDHRGFFIDVGAYTPVEQSDTKHFSEQGWRGINIEPNPAPFAFIQADRERDINLNIGLSDRAGRMAIFEYPGACWSADRRFLTGYYAAGEQEIVEHSIEVRTLAQICDEHVPADTTIDFLKIDVEGHEGAVIAGGDFQRWRPRIILVEATGSPAWDLDLVAAGYHFTLFDGVNRFYVRDEDAHLIPLLSSPANPSDCYSIYGYARRIDELVDSERRLAAELAQVRAHYEQYGPVAHELACKIGRATRRFPRAARVARRLLGRANPPTMAAG